ncbi:hypothetical protein [Microlunatus sp. GCM10028923]
MITPSRPSLPKIISRTLGSVEVPGNGRSTSSLPGWTTRWPHAICAMSP